MARPRLNRRTYQESWLTKIPVLGYFFRKIKEDRIPIETALKTEKAAEGKIENGSFFGGLITTISGKSFDTLKLGKKR